LKQDVDKRCTIPASAGHAIDGSAMLKTFIEECGFAASGQERSAWLPAMSRPCGGWQNSTLEFLK
jgi:hypothetical protein